MTLTATTTSNTKGTSSSFGGLDPLQQFFAVWGLGVVLVGMAVVTVVSNAAMLTMFARRRSLRRCKNVYVASLAAADLGIGLTLPVALLEQLDSRWSPQGLACLLYQTARCSLLYVSLLSVLLVSLDRWWSIHYPFPYRVRHSKKMAALAVTFVWLASLALHVPPVMLWEHVLGREDVMVKGDVIGRDDISGKHDVPRQDDVVALASVSRSTAPSSPPLSLIMTTVVTSREDQDVTSAGDFYDHDDNTTTGHRHINDKEARTMVSGPDSRCHLPYSDHLGYVLTVSVLFYLLPLLALWAINCSLYVKITRRKTIKIRRSLSANEHCLLAFRKSSSTESEGSPNTPGPDTLSEVGGPELRSADTRQKLVATARAGRRHTLAFSPRLGNSSGGAGSVYYPRGQSSRRLSMHEPSWGGGGLSSAGTSSGLHRVTSWGRFSSAGTAGCGAGMSGAMVPGGFWFGSSHRHSVSSSSRKQSEDLVKELLGRQDKKAARLLGLLVTVCTLCWLPHTLLTLLRSTDPDLLTPWLRDTAAWVLVANSAINPFLYGLLNYEFRKMLKDWFYFRRPSRYRLKHALLYCSLPPHGDSEAFKWEGQTLQGLFAAPIIE